MSKVDDATADGGVGALGFVGRSPLVGRRGSVAQNPRTGEASRLNKVHARLVTTTRLRLEGSLHLLSRRQPQLRLERYRAMYRSRPDDIFIATYPKSGTTWMQMIVYQLTSDGAMDFPHISVKSPHLEEDFMAREGRFDDMPSPRVFKTHLRYDDMLRGDGKYIYVVRNGMSVALSYYHHYRSYKLFGGSFDEFFNRYMAGRVGYGSWFSHVGGWLDNKHGLDLLVVAYEDLHADLEGSIKKIAEFCRLEIPRGELGRIVERCRFDFMKQHEAQFDMAFMGPNAQEIKYADLFQSAGSGAWKGYFTEPQRKAFARRFERSLAGLGLDAYALPEHVENGVAPRLDPVDEKPAVPERRPTAEPAERPASAAPGQRLRLAVLDTLWNFTSGSMARLEHMEHALRLRESRLKYVAFPDDLFIASYPRSGTVWVQMIIHQLTTSGDMRFPHLAVFQPYMEAALLREGRRVADLPRPRILMTHLPYERVPKGIGKYIYVMRNGADVAVSNYRRLASTTGADGGFETFFERFLAGRLDDGSWFDHVRGWRVNKEGLDVLYVGYEALLGDFDRTVAEIARF
ncbi:MAG: sulfotransferase domain-containing protein [Thermoanaerobaculia bacterium]|nr:sulfotransferase domain-containing protein [Thermoanaerobaculia bacterium]